MAGRNGKIVGVYFNTKDEAAEYEFASNPNLNFSAWVKDKIRQELGLQVISEIGERPEIPVDPKLMEQILRMAERILDKRLVRRLSGQDKRANQNKKLAARKLLS